MIPRPLIENALALTGKNILDVCEYITYTDDKDINNISIEKFCYYLLSPEFMEGFYCKADMSSEGYGQWEMPNLFGTGIYEYQKGNEEPLISLLEKIGK